ncbi:MAG: hypothetical protein KAG43_10415, partial [Candidatus Marithrix sp.]|nr:hypothetical protein [Candidatus Marithrix sp.]
INLSATVISETQINLSWTDNNTNETGFKIERNGSLITTTAADAISYNNNDLQCGTTYNYSVIATNANGDLNSSSATATTPFCPINDPNNLTTNNISENQIGLSWIDNSNNETGFKIERNGSLIITTASNATSYTDINLTCKTTYNYSVTATNANGDSNSISKIATTSACPVQVTVYHNLTVEKIGNGTITADDGINCGIDCEYNYADQTELSLTTTPNNGWIFDRWDGNCNDNGEVLINSDKSCTATFIKLNEEDLPEEVTFETPKIVNTNGLPITCNVSEDTVNSICNVGQQIFPKEINIGDNASVSNAIFNADVENQGLISNSTIETGVTLTGGSLSGTIINEGIIKDIKFVGNELSGGTLAGNITNESKVGGIIKDVYLSSDTFVKCGKVGGTIIGDLIDKPVITCVTIMPHTILSNVHLSPTVKLSENVIFNEGVTIATEPYTPADFGLDDEDIASLTTESLFELELEALATFDAEDTALIPPQALSKLEAKQIAVLEELDKLTEEQFAEIPVGALEGLTEENMGDFSVAVINKFTPEHVEALKPRIFKKMSSSKASRLLVNFDAKKITPKHVEHLLPTGWNLDMKTGALTPPIGAKFTPPLLNKQLSEDISLPEIVNLDAGIGIGGSGESIKTGMENSLEKEDLTDFVLSQSDTGILNVKGIGDATGKLYTFIPDAENVIQVDTDEIPIGLSVGAGGFYTITTPEGQQYKVIPAPKDPEALSETIGGEVEVGKSGDVLMQLSDKVRSARSFEVVIFDPFVEPAPDSWCIFDDITGESMCDFDNAPVNMQPGIHFPSNRAKLKLPKAKVVYEDGSSQSFSPTVYSPETFLEEGGKYPGVEKIAFNMNGTFYILHESREYIAVPNFNVQTDSKISATKIELNKQGGIIYSVPVETPNKTRRDSRMMLMFDLFIEPAPESWCINNDGVVFCDFDNMPE